MCYTAYFKEALTFLFLRDHSFPPGGYGALP